MSNVFGGMFRVEIFGESHSAAIGVVIDGIPAGFPIDMAEVGAAMARRAPNPSAASTARGEKDVPEILSGCLDGVATGTPLAAMIRNTDTRPGDYLKTANLPRPGHADYTGYVKYKGANDIRGGGHFSGRLTAPLVFAGSIAAQLLARRGVSINARVLRTAGVSGGAAARAVEAARAEGDSVGGIIECACTGLPVGLGEPFFDSAESVLAHIVFSIPAVKGIEFGAGFEIAKMKGSEANDSPVMKDGEVTFASNNNGGVLGGITNGMPLVFRVAVKPTPSIAKEQRTVNIETGNDAVLRIEGRHDACIVPRAVEVVRCAAAIALADLYLRSGIGL